MEIFLKKRRHKTYLPWRSSKKIFSYSILLKWQLGVIKQNKNSNKGLNIPVAHNNKDLYKPIMHPCTGVCVDIKLVPLIVLKLSCSTCHKNIV